MTGEPRWLRGDEPAAWDGLVRLVTLLPGALDRQLREEAGLTHVYYQVLATLSAAPDRSLRMTDLARATGTSVSRLSHAVSSLEQRGWVQRRACAEDRRGQVATLTDQGMALLVEVAPGHVEEVRRRVFDPLTPAEVRQLASLTAKLVDGL